MKIKINPEFHIHINSNFCSSSFIDFLVNDLKFVLSNFDKTKPEKNELNIQPKIHYSLKIFDPYEFRKVKYRLLNFISNNNHFDGYIEGEYIFKTNLIRDEQSSIINYDYFPFYLKLQEDNGLLKTRESEIHISMNRIKSSEKIIEQFISSNFITAYQTKKSISKIIFTAQGSKSDISEIYNLVCCFLKKNKSLVFDCKIKEERTVFLVKSDDCKYMIPQVERIIKPSIIECIE